MYTITLKEDDNKIFTSHGKYVAQVMNTMIMFIVKKYQYRRLNK